MNTAYSIMIQKILHSRMNISLRSVFYKGKTQSEAIWGFTYICLPDRHVWAGDSFCVCAEAVGRAVLRPQGVFVGPVLGRESCSESLPSTLSDQPERGTEGAAPPPPLGGVLPSSDTVWQQETMATVNGDQAPPTLSSTEVVIWGRKWRWGRCSGLCRHWVQR